MRPARTVIAALLSASLALGGPMLMLPGAALANASLKPINVKLGQAKDLTHIEFPGSDPVSSRKDGADLVLRFARASSTDLVQLKVLPPKFLKSAAVTPLPTGLELRLTPADGAMFKQGKADGAAFVNLFAAPDAKPADATPSPKDQVPVRRADPVPAGGVLRMQPELQGKSLAMKFAWRAPVGAAVFRRGDAIWMVFDAKARIDVSNAPHGLVQFRKIEAVNGSNYAAVRILAPAVTLASADAQGPVWTLTLGPGVAAQPQNVALGRDDAVGPATLTAQMAGSTGVFWVSDPAVGDKLAVVTALAPAKGLESRRAMVDAILLPSAQGLAIQPIAEDLSVVADGDIVRIGRPRGLALSPASAPMRRIAPAVQMELPAAASMPALIDFPGWSKTGEGGFERRYAQLLDVANEEGGKGKAAGVQARLGLVRFLIGSELSYEAIGVLDLLAKSNPTMLGDAEFRGLRGAARAMAGRYHDAQADFSSPAVSEDPASALWRGYVDAKLGDFAGAREQFGHGRSALAQFAPEWKARFARMDAEAALAVGDMATARGQLSVAAGEHVSQNEADAIKLDQGRVYEASNQKDQALAFYDDAGKSGYGAVAAPALLRAVALRMAMGKIPPKEAAAMLDSLRFRWRGDGTELETVRTLGHLYLAQGRYREALEALKSAGQRSMDQPAALAVANDLSSAFRALFLDGQADGMQPIQALALFRDFRELTPIGADGDLMLRKMARRLVDVDLLDQAADLLKWQVDNRLNGVAKAQVATDLATLDLMAKKPEAALDAINNSRSTLLPTALNGQRRVVEARALLALGRNDHALELLQGDKSPDAGEVRAEVQWKLRAWPQAGSLLEAQLGDRWKTAGPLTGEEQGRLMRAGIAYSLAGDEAALTRLRTRYAKLAEASNAPDALRVALAGLQGEALSAADFTRAASDAATFSGWVGAMKKRFHDQFAAGPPPAAGSAPKLAKVATVPAPAKAPTKKS